MLSVIKRLWPALAVIVLPVLIMGCGENESGSVEPTADEPMILESALCLDIDGARPVGITNKFLTSDSRIYVWIYWTNLESTSTIEAAWFRPGSELSFHESSQTITSSTGYAITWFSIEKPENGFEEGSWSVDIYLDNLFERSHIFEVE